VLEVFEKIPQKKTYRTWAGYSPDILDEARNKGRNTWLGIRDAVVVFHDLTSPYVENGLFVMQQAGFKTCLFNTMQILGVAWRGNVTIPNHIADPNVLPVTQAHLTKYPISPNHKN